jgi:hypothetical protein
MSIVVGLVEDDVMYMGSDSAISNDARQLRAKNIKLFKTFDLLIGGAGMLKTFQILRWNLVVPAHTKGYTGEEYINLQLIPAIYECIQKNPVPEQSDGEAVTGCNIMVGYQGRFYQIDSYLSCVSADDDFAAIGSGESFALGSLESTFGMEPFERLGLAMSIAAKYDLYVSDPFTYISL